MNIYYIYAYLRKKDLTPYYIGKGKARRAYEKQHTVSVPKDRTKIVFYQTNLTEIDAFKLEISYIKLYGRKDLGTGILLNQTDGGEGTSGRKGPRGKQKNPRKPWDEEYKIKMSLRMKGITFSAEHCAKISAAQTGERNHRFGKKISATQSAQISESNRKRTPPNKGSVWWNNGLVSKLSKIQPDENFVRGRL